MAGMVALQRRVAKVLVHLEGSAQQLLETFEADGEYDRQSNG
jgi:hypothetical protein